MREMLQKLPDGEWLCEECKFAEENESQKIGKVILTIANKIENKYW